MGFKNMKMFIMRYTIKIYYLTLYLSLKESGLGLDLYNYF